MISDYLENFANLLSSIKPLLLIFSAAPSISVPFFNPEKFDYVFLNGCIPDH